MARPSGGTMVYRLNISVSNEELLDVCADFSSWLSLVMLSNNISVTKLSDDIGASTGSISTWRNGVNFPMKTKTLKSICEYFNVPFDKLVDKYFKGRSMKTGPNSQIFQRL